MDGSYTLGKFSRTPTFVIICNVPFVTVPAVYYRPKSIIRTRFPLSRGHCNSRSKPSNAQEVCDLYSRNVVVVFSRYAKTL